MMRPSPNHGTLWLPNDDDDDIIASAVGPVHSEQHIRFDTTCIGFR